MATYTFINGVRKRVFTYNPRVCVNGVIKKIVEGYTFLNGVRHKLFGEWDFVNDKICLDNQFITLPSGTYQFVIRGGGGASGGRGGDGNKSGYTGGISGAGGKGSLTIQTLTFNTATEVGVYVGAGGQGKGNGGAGGNYGVTGNIKGGDGGDGGRPSAIVINGVIYSANGGGGGGGGGGSAWNGRNADGGGGGGGGGYYKITAGDNASRNLKLYIDNNGDILEDNSLSVITITATEEVYAGKQWEFESTDNSIYSKYVIVADTLNNDGSITFTGDFYTGTSATDPNMTHVVATPTTINNAWIDGVAYVSVPGKNGGYGSNYAGGNGVAGNTADFPNISSGQGGQGYSSGGTGGRGASGGGASGGAGGGAGDHSGVASGSGGGGAGGDSDAGGGMTGVTRPGTHGSNWHISATDVLTENQQYGVNSNYGQGGDGITSGTYGVKNNGAQGFILIKRVS